MTLITLNLIHDLLQHEEETRRNAKKLAYQSWEKADAEGADNVLALRELVEKTRESWNAAHTALRDFEAKEW